MAKILLIIISFSLPAVGCKKNNEKPQAPPTPSITYTIHVGLTATQQTIRRFGGATVVRPVLSDSDINILLGNSIDIQFGSIGVRNSGTSKKRINSDANGGTIPVSFMSHITSSIKKLTIESAINIAGTSISYDLPSLSITTLSKIGKVSAVKRLVTLASEII